MNQQCKVCGEPAAGFHFGAFTCEGCKSFFGRSYNNANSISECKNNGKCVINKKNRTACKACRLNKCLFVGMSKSGSRYGRRSNWFKIHCLLQEQKQQQPQLQNEIAELPSSIRPPQKTPPPPHHRALSFLRFSSQPYPPPLLHLPKTKEELMLLGLDEYKHSTSPAISSPESHNSDSSIEVSDARRLPMFPALLPPAFLPHPGLLFQAGYNPLYPAGLLHPSNNNNRLMGNYNPGADVFNKRVLLDAVLKSQRSPTPEETELPAPAESPVQENLPIDLSMKGMSERGSSPARSERSEAAAEKGNEPNSDSDCDSERFEKRMTLSRPIDLTTKV